MELKPFSVTRTKSMVESYINSLSNSSNIDEIKDTFKEFVEWIDQNGDASLCPTNEEFEKLAERISNIEQCLEDNIKKLNLDKLRL